MRICGIQAASFVGRAATQFRDCIRSRLRDSINRTVLCGDEEEHRNAGTGRKYTYWDADLYKEKVLKGFLQEVGNVGSISWHYDDRSIAKWAVQICGEKLVMKKQKSDGTTEYTWRENGPDHDALDSLAQNYAAYASMGFATGEVGLINNLQKTRKMKKKIKIV